MLILATALDSPAHGQSSGSIHADVFAFPDAGKIMGMAPGPDGAIWFTENRSNKIGRIPINATAASPGITEYPIPTTNSQPYGIVAGPDGAMWFTESSTNKVGRIPTTATTSDAGIEEFPLNCCSTHPWTITAGSDGALWVTEMSGDKIVRIPTSATPANPNLTVYALPATDAIGGVQPIGIVTGPDGALWFTEYNSNRIGRLPATGAQGVVEYPIPSEISRSTSPVAGADGAVWFKELAVHKIGRIPTTATVAKTGITEFPLPSPPDSIGGGSGFQALAVGLDGALWFTEQSRNVRLARMGAAATVANPGVTDYAAVGDQGGLIAGPSVWYNRPIVADPNGAMWFTGASEILRAGGSTVVTFAGLPTGCVDPNQGQVYSEGELTFTSAIDGMSNGGVDGFSSLCAGSVNFLTVAPKTGSGLTAFNLISEQFTSSNSGDVGFTIILTGTKRDNSTVTGQVVIPADNSAIFTFAPSDFTDLVSLQESISGNGSLVFNNLRYMPTGAP